MAQPKTMSSSYLFMSLPPPTPVIYPHSAVTGTSSPSRGSFGPVFVVLAVITILSAIACFLGRILARRYFQPPRRRERSFSSRDGMEDGFEMDLSPPTRIFKEGEVKAEYKPSHVGGTKGEAMSTATTGGSKTSEV